MKRTAAVAEHRSVHTMRGRVWEFCRYSFMASRRSRGRAVSLFHALVRPEHPRLRMVGETDMRIVLLRRRRREEEELRVLSREGLGAADQFLPDPVLLVRRAHRQVRQV